MMMIVVPAASIITRGIVPMLLVPAAIKILAVVNISVVVGTSLIMEPARLIAPTRIVPAIIVIGAANEVPRQHGIDAVAGGYPIAAGIARLNTRTH
jgi:hypothetical protein